MPADTTDATAVHPIVASKLSKRYREVLAVDGVDIDLPRGIVAGFVPAWRAARISSRKAPTPRTIRRRSRR